MATAHIHQHGTTEIIAVVMDGASKADVKAVMTRALNGPGVNLTVVEPGAGRVNVPKSKIKDITYTD